MRIPTCHRVAALVASFAAAVALCGSALPASAELAADFTTGMTAPGGVPGHPGITLGWEFSTTEALTVDALGIWDQDSDGLSASHEVGLWNVTTGDLLATATLSSASSVVPSSSSMGQWLFTSIDALTLAPGEYVLGATYGAAAPDIACYMTDATCAPGVTFVGDRQIIGPSLTLPTIYAGLGNAIFGPNMHIARTADVPEPGSLALLGGLGVASLISVRRLKRRAK